MSGGEMATPSLAESTRQPGTEKPMVRRQLLLEAGYTIAAAVAAAVIGCWILRDGLANLNETWGAGDSPANYMYARALLDHLWITPNPDLGWPYGLDLASYPVPDLLPLIQLKILAVIAGDPVLAINLFFLLGYPAAAATGYLLMRWAGVMRPIAVLLAVGFVTVPWHALRFHHLFFANYAMIAAALVLVSAAVADPPGMRWLRRRQPLVWILLTVLALAVGMSGAYVAVFALVLLGCAVIVRLATRGLQGFQVWVAALIAGGLTIGFGASLAIGRLLAASPGAAEITDRPASDAYLYGGDLASLLLPSRLTWLSNFVPERFVHQTSVMGEIRLVEGDAYASPLIAVACIAALIISLGVALGGRQRALLRNQQAWPGLLILCVLAFVIGGFGAIVAQGALPQIRSWGRLSIWIMLIALIVLGLLLTALATRARNRPLVTAVICAVLIVLVLDQSTQANPNPPNTGQREGLEGIRTYADAVLDPTCPIFTYPSKEFPESGQVNEMIDYAHFYPYLYLGEHPISYGSVKGTTEDLWQRQLPPDPAGLAQVVAGMGFCGILVDSAYWPAADRQAQLQSWTQALSEPKASALDRWYLFPLRAVSATDAAGARARWDVIGVPTNATTGADYAIGAISWWHGASDLDLTLVNNTQEPRRGLVTVDVAAAPCLSGPITVDAPGAEPASLELAPGQRATIGYRVDLAGDGYRDAPIRINGIACQVSGDPRPLLLQVFVGGFQPD